MYNFTLPCSYSYSVIFGSRFFLKPFHIFRLNAWSSLSIYQPSNYLSDLAKVLSFQCSSLFVKWNMLGKLFNILSSNSHVLCNMQYSLHTISNTTMPSLQRMKYSIGQAFEIQKMLAGSLSSVQFSRSVVSDSLPPHESQHARPPGPSPTPRVHSDSRPSSQ